jgi:hypothetical protein
MVIRLLLSHEGENTILRKAMLCRILTFDFRAGEEIMQADKRWKYIFYLLRKSLLPLIKAWINEAPLKVGDDIMYVLVAGRLRTNVLPTFSGALSVAP